MGYNGRNDEIRDNVTRMRRAWAAERQALADVCFAFESGHVRRNEGCPLCANSGYCAGKAEAMVRILRDLSLAHACEVARWIA